MRTFLTLLTAITICFISCSKEGPQGPAGPQGATGATGEKGDKGDKGATGTNDTNGATGTANVIYSGWINASISKDTIIDNTTLRTCYLNAPKLTSTIVNSGLVLVYLNYGAGTFPLPYTSNAGGKSSTINFIPGAGKIILTRYTWDNTGSISFGSGNQYRYILVPGGVSARMAGVDLSDYNAVKKFFGIED